MQEDKERSEFQVLHQDMALYARINCQNKFVAPDELPAVQVASESGCLCSDECCRWQTAHIRILNSPTCRAGIKVHV